MLMIQIVSVLALLCSCFCLYIVKKQDEVIDTHWISIYYLLAFMQSEFGKEFGDRKVTLKDTDGNPIDLEEDVE